VTDILKEASELVGGDRAQDYGHPYDDYTRVARIWEGILGLPTMSIDPARAAMCMIAVKMSREINKPKRDNRVDMAGYAWVIDKIRERQEETDREIVLDPFQ